VIYAIRAVGTEYIKFGYTAPELLRVRLGTLQIGCPFELEMVAYGPGDLAEEQRVHVHLTAAGRHFRGEWFISSPETQEIVDRLKAYKKPDDPIPQMRQGRGARLGRVLEYAAGVKIEALPTKRDLSPIEKRRAERRSWWASREWPHV
jgi:hypothetical protein